MNPKFVVSHLDQQLGPGDEQELKMKWAAGEILPIDYVYDEAKEDWILLADRFLWAAKPVKDDGSAPPPIREVNIMKRTPPPNRPTNEVSKVTTNPLPKTDNSTAETLKQAMQTIRYTEIAPRKEVTQSQPMTASIAPTPVVQTPVAPTPVAHTAPAPTPVVTTPSAPAPATINETYLKLDMMMPLATTETIPLALTTPAPAQSATPAVRPSTPFAPPSPVIQNRPATITLVNGVAEIDFVPKNPGELELEARDTTGSNIRSTEPLKVHVKPLEPVEVTWEFASSQTVGHDLEVKVRATDDRGLLCEHYEDQFVIKIRGPVSHDVVIHVRGGVGTVKLQHTKSERWELALQYGGTKKLQLPEPAEVEWMPGPAVRLVLDGPHEYLAGDPMKVKVKAVDAYGNTAKTFQGTVALEVKAG